MEKKLRLYQIATWVLFLLLAVAIVYIEKQQGDLKQALKTQSMSVEQDRIRVDCAGNTVESKAACAKDIQDLSDTLSQFTKGLGTPGTTTKP